MMMTDFKHTCIATLFFYVQHYSFKVWGW